jgi:hypothetical protein
MITSVRLYHASLAPWSEGVSNLLPPSRLSFGAALDQIGRRQTHRKSAADHSEQ